MRFVFDTNVVVAAFVTPRGLTAELLRAVLNRHRLIVSPAMAAEYGAVLVRAKFGSGGTERDRLARLQRALDDPACLAVRPPIRLALVADDPSDNRFLEAAVWAGADYLVSGDTHLLALKQVRSPHLKRPVPIVAPNARDVLRLLPVLRPRHAVGGPPSASA